MLDLEVNMTTGLEDDEDVASFDYIWVAAGAQIILTGHGRFCGCRN